MNVFNRRISLDEAAAIIQVASKSGLLSGRSSAIFHHLGLMRSRIAELRDVFPQSCLHTIAIKANPIVEILREIVQMEVGLEAASIEEVGLARAAGCPAECIVFDSPAKTVAEIRQALEWGVYLNANNFEELDRAAAVQKQVKSASRVGLRINTMVGRGAIEHTSVSAVSSKFGVSLQNDREKIIGAFKNYPWLTGLHCHVGSQGCPLELLVEAAARVAALRLEIAEQADKQVSRVDIGGGLSTSYCTGELAPTPSEYRTLLEQRSPGLFGDEVCLITEFGRAIHANCGLAASRVEYVKPSQPLAVIHLGADFLLRPVYQPENWQHELFVVTAEGTPKPGPLRPTTVAGPLCFAGDIVARNVMLPPIQAGDWILIRDVGAYTLSMWSRHCSRAIPIVLGYEPGRKNPLRVLRKSETVDDIVRFWS
jgi:diaminopimelate decarboxylase